MVLHVPVLELCNDCCRLNNCIIHLIHNQLSIIIVCARISYAEFNCFSRLLCQKKTHNYYNSLALDLVNQNIHSSIHNNVINKTMHGVYFILLMISYINN